jgi:transitional endoplasmic reticulum ATPase
VTEQSQPNITVAALMLPQLLGISEEAMTKAQILAHLKKLGGDLTNEEAITCEGTRFIVPATYKGNLPAAAQFLLSADEQLNTHTDVSRVFRYRPNDVAYALAKAMKKVFATTGIGTETRTMFGRTPPSFKTIDIGLGETDQIIQGSTKFPPLDAVITVGMEHDREVGYLGKISVKAPRRFMAEVNGLFVAIEEELREDSIYRGKAIDGAEDPHFLDISHIDPERVIYTPEVMTQLNANIWSLLDHTGVMRDMRLPLRRAVLLEGPYGTGKSLAALITAQKAVENGWTFVQVRPDDDLKLAMQTAALYAPAVVFFEDVDGVAEKGDPLEVSKLLDLFDGIGAKGNEVVAVMTTNHVKRIQVGMLRPGRLDAVISIGAMDAAGYERLVKATVPSHLMFEVDYVKVAAAYEGFVPAFAKEATDRAMRYAIARTGGEDMFLTTDDFVSAAEGLRPQLELMREATEGKRTPALDAAFKVAMQEAFNGVDVVDIEYGDEGYEEKSPALRTRVQEKTLNG